MPRSISVTLPDEDFERLQRAVSDGDFESTDAAVQAGLARVLARDEQEIADAYRRAYSGRPQDPRLGEAGAALMAEVVEAEERRSA